MSRVFGATPFYINDTTSRDVKHHDPTKLTVKLTRDRTKLKRPILFLQPALTEDLDTSHHVYALRGKDRNLFGLRRAPDGVWALFDQVYHLLPSSVSQLLLRSKYTWLSSKQVITRILYHSWHKKLSYYLPLRIVIHLLHHL